MNVKVFGKNLNIKKREEKGKKLTPKSKFVAIVEALDDLDKRSVSLNALGVDTTNYEDPFFSTIEYLVHEIYGDWKTELIMWYVYDRFDEEGNLNPLLVQEEDENGNLPDEEDDMGEEVFIETPEQLYSFIKKLEKKPKK